MNQYKTLGKKRALVLEYLSTHPCIDCGEADPVVLHFDHRGDKKAGVSDLIYHGRISELMPEIKKCDVRCANCHLKKHFSDGKSYKSVSSGIDWV